MKIGLPKIRFTRKVLLISVGMLALLTGSGAAALYAGVGDVLVKSEPADSPVGGACSTVQTMVLKTPAKRLWLRKIIRVDHAANGPTRIKTALRVAGLLANANPAVDLVQVSVLDHNGPTLRAEMRGRAIGAEVVIALQPKYLPDMKAPFIVRYYEGLPTDDGHYYGERISLDVPEIQKLVRAMRDVPDKEDCIELPRPDDKSPEQAGKKPGDHIVSVEGEAPSGHDAKPENEDKKAEGHDAPAAESADASGHETAPKKEQSFLDSVLSLVGLGGSAEEKPAEGHEAKADDNSAVADDAAELPRVEDHAADPAKAEDAGKQADAEPSGHDAQPEQSAAH